MPDHLARLDPLEGLDSLRRDPFDAGTFRGLRGGTSSIGVLSVPVLPTPGTGSHPIPITRGHSKN
ncbi:hypothetical protein [Nesterenkonia sp. CF4.4]|uniref:hypothetical protein n=1 Tax=Nesterenkonia sp. CF4.4 TaxID=3373079 RepID=UPI003EE616D1